MSRKLVPEDLQNDNCFELLAEVSHQNLREFVLEQIKSEKYIIRIYSVYQVIMLFLLVFLITRSVVFSVKGHPETLLSIGLAILFSFTALAQTILAMMILKLKINYPIIGKLLLFVGFVFLAGYFSRQINNWVLGYFIMIGSSLLFAFVTRLINLKALTEIILDK